MTNTTAQTEDSWSMSRNGKLNICLRPAATNGGNWEVYALYVGTHELAPRSRSFPTEAAARAYANQVWAAR